MEIMHKGMWTGRRVLYLSVDAIRANPDQPRKYFEPEALRELPVPTHVFIGGSSGNLKDILALALEKNPRARIVLNTVTAETFAEAVEAAKTLPVNDFDIAEISAARGRC